MEDNKYLPLDAPGSSPAASSSGASAASSSAELLRGERDLSRGKPPSRYLGSHQNLGDVQNLAQIEGGCLTTTVNAMWNRDNCTLAGVPPPSCYWGWCLGCTKLKRQAAADTVDSLTTNSCVSSSLNQCPSFTSPATTWNNNAVLRAELNPKKKEHNLSLLESTGAWLCLF